MIYFSSCFTLTWGVGYGRFRDRRRGRFVYLFLSLCLLTYLYSSSSVSPLKRNKEKKREEALIFFFFESSSRLTIFISCSDSHESCHSCFSSTHVHGACGESWRFPLKRMQWSEMESHNQAREKHKHTENTREISIRSGRIRVPTRKNNDGNRALK